MLDKYFVYECEQCERGWNLEAFNTHKNNGFCEKDLTAYNHATTIRQKATEDRESRPPVI